MKSRVKLNEGEVLFRKLGGGSFRFGGKIIKPGQTFAARPEVLPKAFMDLFEIVSGGEEAKTKAKALKENKEETIAVTSEEVKSEEYSLQLNKDASTKTNKLYDIVDGDGKKVNDEPLNKTIAEETIKQLTA